jgi:hypothetical protein
MRQNGQPVIHGKKEKISSKGRAGKNVITTNDMTQLSSRFS